MKKLEKQEEKLRSCSAKNRAKGIAKVLSGVALLSLMPATEALTVSAALHFWGQMNTIERQMEVEQNEEMKAILKQEYDACGDKAFLFAMCGSVIGGWLIAPGITIAAGSLYASEFDPLGCASMVRDGFKSMVSGDDEREGFYSCNSCEAVAK